MARLYHVDIARHVAAADHKWVDNLLSHFDIPGVEVGRQGSRDESPRTASDHIALVRVLTSRARTQRRRRCRAGRQTARRNRGRLAIGERPRAAPRSPAFRARRSTDAIADAVESVVAGAARTAAQSPRVEP